MNHTTSNEDQNQDLNLKAVLDKYLIHWKWFLLGVFISLTLAFIYLRYAIPQYQAATTILVKDEKKGGMLSELSAFADMGLGGGLKSNVDNEIEILKSRTLVESTVKKLNLNISLIVKGKVINSELFKNSPIEVFFVNTSPEFYESKIALQFLAALLSGGYWLTNLRS